MLTRSSVQLFLLFLLGNERTGTLPPLLSASCTLVELGTLLIGVAGPRNSSSFRGQQIEQQPEASYVAARSNQSTTTQLEASIHQQKQLSGQSRPDPNSLAWWKPDGPQLRKVVLPALLPWYHLFSLR